VNHRVLSVALVLLAAVQIQSARAAGQSSPAATNVPGAPTPSIHVGTAEPEQFRAGIGEAAQALKQAGVRVEYFEAAGTAHEWQTWRRSLNDFVPRLFR
jgi:acetyl esterase/lipase